MREAFMVFLERVRIANASKEASPDAQVVGVEQATIPGAWIEI